MSDFETEGKRLEYTQCIYKILEKNNASSKWTNWDFIHLPELYIVGLDQENSYLSAYIVISYSLKEITINY